MTFTNGLVHHVFVRTKSGLVSVFSGTRPRDITLATIPYEGSFAVASSAGLAETRGSWTASELLEILGRVGCESPEALLELRDAAALEAFRATLRGIELRSKNPTVRLHCAEAGDSIARASTALRTSKRR